MHLPNWIVSHVVFLCRRHPIAYLVFCFFFSLIIYSISFILNSIQKNKDANTEDAILIKYAREFSCYCYFHFRIHNCIWDGYAFFFLPWLVWGLILHWFFVWWGKFIPTLIYKLLIGILCMFLRLCKILGSEMIFGIE